MPTAPVIPETITVHLGPPDSDAENVTVRFPSYIRNVASSELYPTWNESALRANIYSFVSFALNRILTGHYRKQGYDFDITNSPEHDQAYTFDRAVFGRIGELTDELFNDYIVKGAANFPYLATNCAGREGPCNGAMSKWGSQALAETGYLPWQLLQYYYGNDIGVLRNAPVENLALYEGPVMRIGSADENVRDVQIMLNTIAEIYQAIPRIPVVTGIYDEATRNAVVKFQDVFNLTQDGLVGKTTWYKIQHIYDSMKQGVELYEIGLALEGIPELTKQVLKPGDKSDYVTFLQHYLRTFATFYEKAPPVKLTRVFDEPTRRAVVDLQESTGLKVDGIVGPQTWEMIQRIYRGITREFPPQFRHPYEPRFPGTVTASSPPGVIRIVQYYLRRIAEDDENIPLVEADGVFGPETREAIMAFQKAEGLPVTGTVPPPAWFALVQRYNELAALLEHQEDFGTAITP